MAGLLDWKALLTRWDFARFGHGDPKLDAIGAMYSAQGLDWKARAVEQGNFFTVKAQDLYTVGDVAYGVIKTNDKPLRLINIGYQVRYGDITDGQFTIRTEMFIQGSDLNTWSYTGGVISNSGKPINTTFINNKPETDVVIDPIVTLTGESDFLIRLIDYFRDSSGGRDMLTGVEQSFFNNEKYILIPPNSEALIRRQVEGTIGNSAEVYIYYDYAEGEINV